jgi:hypothetical protein
MFITVEFKSKALNQTFLVAAEVDGRGNALIESVRALGLNETLSELILPLNEREELRELIDDNYLNLKYGGR